MEFQKIPGEVDKMKHLPDPLLVDDEAGKESPKILWHAMGMSYFGTSVRGFHDQDDDFFTLREIYMRYSHYAHIDNLPSQGGDPKAKNASAAIT